MKSNPKVTFKKNIEKKLFHTIPFYSCLNIVFMMPCNRFWFFYNFRKCASRPCASPSSWRARAGRLSQVCDTSIRNREVTATSATSAINDWNWPNRRATSYAPCGGTRRDKAEPLKPPIDTQCTRSILIYGRVTSFPSVLYILADTCEVRLLCLSKPQRIFRKSSWKLRNSLLSSAWIDIIFL